GRPALRADRRLRSHRVPRRSDQDVLRDRPGLDRRGRCDHRRPAAALAWSVDWPASGLASSGSSHALAIPAASAGTRSAAANAMRNHDELSSLDLEHVLGGSKPDLRFLTPAQKACTTSQSKIARQTGLDDMQIAARCGLSPALQKRYANA